MTIFSLPRLSLVQSARRFTSRRLLAVLAPLAVGVPGIIGAQETMTLSADVSEQLSKALSQQLQKMMERRVKLSPALVSVDAAKRTATIEFSNATTDTLEASVSISHKTPTLAPGNVQGGAAQAGGLLADDEDNSEKSDTIAESQSLASWVSGLPTRIKLAPGEKKSVTVTLAVPAGTKAGDYAAWVIAKTDPPEGDAVVTTNAGTAGVSSGAQPGINGSFTVKFGGKGGFPSIPTAAKLVYTVPSK